MSYNEVLGHGGRFSYEQDLDAGYQGSYGNGHKKQIWLIRRKTGRFVARPWLDEPMLGTKPVQIIPRVGLNDVQFGMSREQVRSIVGEPEELATYEEGTDDASEAWYFWADGISYHFDADSDWRLTTIEVSSPEALLEDRAVIGIPQSELVDLLHGRNAYWPDSEEEPVSVAEWDMNFWIQEGVLTDIQWGVPIGNDDREIWPC